MTRGATAGGVAHKPNVVPVHLPGRLTFRPGCKGCGWIGPSTYALRPAAFRAACRHVRESR